MAKKSKKSTASLDVRSPKDIPVFESLLKKGPMAVVLVYADWCGHCQTFKEKVWNSQTLNRTKNLNNAAVHYDMVDQTSLKNTPIKGYPSMFLVGKDANAKEIPTPQSPEELVSLDSKSGNVLNNGNGNNNANNNMNNGNLNNTNNLNSSNRNSSFLNTPNNNSYTPSPPDALNDVMNTSERLETDQRGGSLMDLLSSFSQGSVDVPEQKGGRRKTRRRRGRRSQTRRRR
jgi:thiol-disulfide isomerase/thioredoxin